MTVPRGLLQFLAVSLLLLGSLFHLSPLQAQDHSTEDIVRQVKAAYLFKFGNYVLWPAQTFASDQSPIVIGVVAEDRMADELTRIAAGRTISQRPVSIRRLQYGEPVSGVHILFIGHETEQSPSNLLKPLRGEPVLGVTEEDRGLMPGGIINFVLDNNRVRFDVSLAAAEQNHLQLSAALRSVARKVEESNVE
jgi:hypothetical protein